MRVIRIVPVLAILTATVLVASIFAFSVVGSVDATHLPEEELQAIALRVTQVAIVHTDDLAVKGVVIDILEPDPPTTINFLDLQGGILTGLGICDDIPVGFVTQIRLVVTQSSIAFNGEVHDLFIPNGVVKLNGVLTVSADEDAVFVFDAEKSLITNNQHEFILKPVLKFEKTNTDC